MDDLNGLSWSASSNEPKKPPPMSSSTSGLLFPDVRRNDTSGRSTPLSTSSGRSNPSTNPTTTPAGDSFANLVSFGSSNTNSTKNNLSLVEQQKRLQEERAQKDAENKNRFETQYGAQNAHFWDSLEKGRNGPVVQSQFQSQSQSQSQDEDDILAAFNSAAPVDASTHFPIPDASPSPRVGTTPQPVSNGAASSLRDPMAFPDDDDPFGLGQTQAKPAPVPSSQLEDDDDFLGDLNKPVSEFSQPEPPPKLTRQAAPRQAALRQETPRQEALPTNDEDRAVAELVDMGFPADKASQALSTTSSGTDIQAAVSWLLTQAHKESQQKAGRGRTTPGGLAESERGRASSARRDREAPWPREERPQMTRNWSDHRSPTSEKDPSQIAAQVGNNFLKTANSWWKTGSKKVQQAVHDLNSDHDPNQPRWMKEVAAREGSQPERAPRTRNEPPPPQNPDLTDEALLLEPGAAPARPRQSRNPFREQMPAAGGSDIREQSLPAREPAGAAPAFLRQQTRTESREPRSRVNKVAVEEQSARAYVSPARRKRPVAPSPAPEPTVDLFESSPAVQPAPPSRARTAPLPTRLKAPPRTIPPVSPEALASTNRHRSKAADAYKRGDYGAAHESFATALSMLPDKHPIGIVIRSNHAMTALKIGEPKSALNDADAMLDLIGPSKGEDEQIDPGTGDANKPMRDFYGKALMRKAEAQEQLERWADAAQTWRQAVETGHGGGTSIQGRNRCEQAAGISKPTPKPTPKPAARRPAAPKPSALADLTASASGLGSGSAAAVNSAAVNRLRQANEAAERADDEKFALSESVDARLAAWRNGKQDNLRALLGSLDTVLWPEAGWKKVNMSELIMPNKVKINYMKGIGKVHPDKVIFSYSFLLDNDNS